MIVLYFYSSESQTTSSTTSPSDSDEFTGRKKVFYDYEEHTPTRIIIENGRRPVMKDTEDTWRPGYKKKYSDSDSEYDDNKYHKYNYKEKPHTKRKPYDVYEPLRETYYSQAEYYEDERPVRKRPGVLELDEEEDEDDEFPPRRKTPPYIRQNDDNKKAASKKSEASKNTPKPNANKNKQEENKKKASEKSSTPTTKKQDKNKPENKILLVTLTNKNNNSSKIEERVDHKKEDLKEERIIIKHKHPKIPFVHFQKHPHNLSQKDKDVLLKIGKLKIGLVGGTIAMLFITLVDFIIYTMYKSKDKDMQKIIDNLPPQYVSDIRPSQKPSNALVDMGKSPNYAGGQMQFNPHDSSLNQIPYAPISDSKYNNIQNQLNTDMLKYLSNIQAQTGGQFNLSDLKVPDDLLSLDIPPQGNFHNNYNLNFGNQQPYAGVGTFDDSILAHGFNSNTGNPALYNTAQQYPSIDTTNSYQPENPTNLDSGTLSQLMSTPQKNESDKTQYGVSLNTQSYNQLPLDNDLKVPNYQLPLANEVEKPNYQQPASDYNNKGTFQNTQSQTSQYSSSYSNTNDVQNDPILQAQSIAGTPQFLKGNINLQNAAENFNLQKLVSSPNINQYHTTSQPAFHHVSIPSSTQAPIHPHYKVTSQSINPYPSNEYVANAFIQANHNHPKDVNRQDPYKQISNVLSNQFDYSSNNPVAQQFLQNPYDQQIAASPVTDSDFVPSNNYVQITSRPTKLQSKYKRIIKRRKRPMSVPRYRIRSSTENSVPVSPSGRFKRNADFDTVDSFIRIRNTLVEKETPTVLLNSNEEFESSSNENNSDGNSDEGNKESNETEDETEYEEESKEEVTQKSVGSTTAKYRAQDEYDSAVTEVVIAPMKFTLLSLSGNSGTPTKTVVVSAKPIASIPVSTEKYYESISAVNNEKVSTENNYKPVLTENQSSTEVKHPVVTESTKKHHSAISSEQFSGSVSTGRYNYNIPEATNKYEEILQPVSITPEAYYSPVSEDKYIQISTAKISPIVNDNNYNTETTRKYYSTVNPVKYFATMSSQSFSTPNYSTSKVQESNEESTLKSLLPVVSPDTYKTSVVTKDVIDEDSEEEDDKEQVYPTLVSTLSPVVINRKPIEEATTPAVKTKTEIKTVSSTERNKDSKKKRPQSTSNKSKKKNKNQVESTTKSSKKTKKKSSKKPSSKRTAEATSGSKTKTIVKEDNEKFKHIEQIQEDGSKVIKIIIEPPSYKDPKKDEDDGEYGLYDDDDKPEPPGSDDYFSFGIGSPKDAQEELKEKEEAQEEEAELKKNSEEEDDDKSSEEEEESDEEEKDAEDSDTTNPEEDDEDDDDLGNALSLFYNAVMLDGASVIDTGILS